MRRLDVLARQLLKNRTTALAQAVSPVGTAWGPTEYVLSDLIDYFAAVNFKNPKPYPRPADREQERLFTEQRRAALEAQAERIKAQREEAEGAT